MPFAWISTSTTEKQDRLEDAAQCLEAIGKTTAIIEFSTEGIILTANENFLQAFGYQLQEIQGQHHRMMVDKQYASSAEYRQFWDRLHAGEIISGEFLRIAKNGSDVYIQATYSPVFNNEGTLYKFIKLATVSTTQALKNAEYGGQVAAIGRSQAVIHFGMDATIEWANENFLTAMGYRLEQIEGKKHSMFVDPQEVKSAAYQQFWEKLREGSYVTGEFKRFGANNKEVWLQASYNPIHDKRERPFKIVKIASDITKQVTEAASNKGLLDAINVSQCVAHFEMDGTILWANELLLKALGYRLDEIKGRPCSMLIPTATMQSAEYQNIWKMAKEGQASTGTYPCTGSGRREVLLHSTYNPILNVDGEPIKVVLFAQNVTDEYARRLEGERAVNDTLEQIVNSVSAVSTQSTAAASASESTLATVQAVASASEELSASIREIASSMAVSRGAVNEVMVEAASADESTQRLGEKANSMTKVVELIQEIAEQINLLSLNAAIESARAGDAGRGFAVVASEVKNLANQVQGATRSISTEISDMQMVSRDVVKALGHIRQSVQSVHDAVSSTASAVEEQTVVTREISSNMLKATSSVGSINDSLSFMIQSVEQTNTVAIEGKALFAKVMNA